MIYDYTKEVLRREAKNFQIDTAKGMKKYRNCLSNYRRNLTQFTNREDKHRFKSEISLLIESIDIMQKVLLQYEQDRLEEMINTEKCELGEKIEAGIATEEEIIFSSNKEKEFFNKYFRN